MACVRKRRGKWVIDFYDQFGKRHWETVGTNKKEAEEKLATRLLEISSSTFNPGKGMVVFSELALAWFQNHAKVNVRPNTCYTYQGHLNKHLIPFFGQMKVIKITPAIIDRFKTQKLRENLDRQTINKILVTLSSIFRYAVRNRFVRHNIMKDVDKLSTFLKEKDGGRFEEMNILTPEEINLLLEHTAPKHRPLILTAILTGMRQSELKKWKLACPLSEHNLVFPTLEGNPMNPANLRTRIFEPALRRAGLRKIRFHDLRHTFASL